jgi:transposase
MAKKHLSKADIKSLSEMLKSGKTNAEVASHFKVSLATVNNHRTRLKREGMSFPSKRGRKPKAQSAGSSAASLNSLALSAAVAQKGSKRAGSKAEKISTSVPMEQYDFVVNGVRVSVSGKAKDVYIGKAAMVINF